MARADHEARFVVRGVQEHFGDARLFGGAFEKRVEAVVEVGVPLGVVDQAGALALKQVKGAAESG